MGDINDPLVYLPSFTVEGTTLETEIRCVKNLLPGDRVRRLIGEDKTGQTTADPVIPDPAERTLHQSLCFMYFNGRPTRGAFLLNGKIHTALS
jgi:hypothetical protein